MIPVRPDHTSLAAWLLGHAGEVLPPAAVLRASKLAAYAYAALPPGNHGRAELRPDYLAALTRHEQIKRELVPLIQRWNAKGIEPLLFKGFHLAELVYPVPGMRHHGDVDLLVRPEQAALASELAQGEGWAEEHNSARAGRPYMHGVCSLYGPRGATCVDLHRWVIHCVLPWNRVQRRISEAVWDRSDPLEWAGTRIRVPAPVDALLVGLVLHRSWGDHWVVKPHDVLDFRFITERLGVTRASLLERASELRVSRTLSQFLARCDPEAGVLELRTPTHGEIRRWDRAVLGERGFVNSYERPLRRMRNLPQALAGFARAIPSLVAAHRALARRGDVDALLQSLTPRTASRPRCSPAWRDRLVIEVLRGARHFPRDPDGDCLLRSLALCHLLWHEGWPARFVSGVRRDGGAVQGHAWVELDGRVLTELYESGNRQRYSVLVEYLPPAMSDASSAS